MIFNAHHVQVENETSRSLTTFGSDTKVLGKLLMRFSQSEKTLGSQAVLHALLGLASLARYGYNEQAMELKIASLRALGKGLESCHNAFERVYHVAAGMLLCSIEVIYPYLYIYVSYVLMRTPHRSIRRHVAPASGHGISEESKKCSSLKPPTRTASSTRAKEIY